MPLKKGKSQKTISQNIKELVTTKPGKARAKGIRTFAKHRNISIKKAKQLQAEAIAENKAREDKETMRTRKIRRRIRTK